LVIFSQVTLTGLPAGDIYPALFSGISQDNSVLPPCALHARRLICRKKLSPFENRLGKHVAADCASNLDNPIPRLECA